MRYSRLFFSAGPIVSSFTAETQPLKQEVATDPERTRTSVFFADPVLLEDGDPDLNLALTPSPQIIWGQNQHYIQRKPLFIFIFYFLVFI